MDLITPTRHTPTSVSFPTSPKKVKIWLSDIYPITNALSTRSFTRGIKHFNRLQNSIRNRFEVMEIFRPAVAEIVNFSEKQYISQNLPLSNKEQNTFNTVHTLLQELAFGYMSIVAEGGIRPAPGTVKIHHHSIILAMEVLLEIAMKHIQIYRKLPDTLWKSVNRLYDISNQLQISEKNLSKSANTVSDLSSIQEYFIVIHLLHVLPSQAIRKGQAYKTYQFIVRVCSTVIIHKNFEEAASIKYAYAVNIGQAAPITELKFIQHSNSENLYILDFDALMETISQDINTTPSTVSALYEADVLTQDSLKLFEQTIRSTSKRACSRGFCNREIQTFVGLKEIYASYRYKGQDQISRREKWVQINLSLQGTAITWQGKKSPQVTVGELIESQEIFGVDSNSGYSCKVVWIQADEKQNLSCGLKFIASNAAPVIVENTRGSNHGITTSTECLAADMLDDLENPSRCIIVPPHTFNSNEIVKLKEKQQTLHYKLLEKVESTGTFAQFLIEPH